MEVLARISVQQFGHDANEVMVQYVQHDPPDGIITLTDRTPMFIECTSARDSRWENFVLDQMRKHRRIISLSGYEGGDISGSRARGYKVKGMDITDEEVADYLVEADEQGEAIERHRKQIIEKIENKLGKEWLQRCNWLAVYVNEFVIPGGSYRCMAALLNEICSTYRNRLQSKHIEALLFVSNRIDDAGWYSFHEMRA